MSSESCFYHEKIGDNENLDGVLVKSVVKGIDTRLNPTKYEIY